MKSHRLVVALTVINLVILMLNLLHVRPATAQAGDPVLRARGLEIVDDQGRVRAQLKVFPASTMKDGQKYPETTLFRLIDPNGRPGVKIGTSVDGSGIGLAGDSERRDWSGVQILAKGTGSTVKLTNKNGRVLTVEPK